MALLLPRPSAFSLWWSELLCASLVCLAQFILVGITTQGLALMNIVQKDFPDMAPGDTAWFMAAFLLCVLCLILVSGRIGDRYGLKRFMILGYAWIVVWCIVCGVSVYLGSSKLYIACRAFLGVGFAFILPCGLGILGRIYPQGSRKNLVFGAFGAAAPVGALLGALITGALGDYTWWPWSYYMLAMGSFVMGILAWLVIPPVDWEPRFDDNGEEIPDPMDWIGMAMGVLALVLIGFAWNQAPIAGWNAAYVPVLLGVGVIDLAGFFYYELHMAPNPLLPATVANARTGLVLLAIGFGWALFGVWTYYYWAFVLNLRHYSATDAGLLYMPLLVFGIVAAGTVLYLILRINPAILIVCLSWAFLTGILMLSLTPVHQSYYIMVLIQMIPLSFGMDLSFPSSSIILLNFLPPHQQGMAGSIVTTVTQYGMTLGLGIAGTVEMHTAHGSTAEERLLNGYRGAMYLGVGLAGAGAVSSAVLLATTWHAPIGGSSEDEKSSSDNSA